MLSMTYGIKTISGVVSASPRKGFWGTKDVLFGSNWDEIKLGGWCPMTFAPWTLGNVYTYVFGAHLGHVTELLVALVCWMLLFQDGAWLEECKTIQVIIIFSASAMTHASSLVFHENVAWLQTRSTTNIIVDL